MELVVKLYDGKPSRIGIRYIYEYMAVKDYETLISKHGSSEFTLSIELVRGKPLLFCVLTIREKRPFTRTLNLKQNN